MSIEHYYLSLSSLPSSSSSSMVSSSASTAEAPSSEYWFLPAATAKTVRCE